MYNHFKYIQLIYNNFFISSADKVSLFTNSVARSFNLDSLSFNKFLTLL